MSSSIATGLDYQALWAHFKEQANSLKESMAATSTWAFGIASGLLAFVVGKFLSFDGSGIAAHLPGLGTFLCLVGALLVVHTLSMIKHFDAHIHGNWARAVACETHLPGIATVVASGDPHDGKVPTLASRLRFFAYVYLAAFAGTIILLFLA